jgi:integrase
MGEVIKRTKNGKFLGYYLRWYEGGKRRQMASKQPSHAEARRMLLEIEARVARGEAGIAERQHPMSLAELVERFLAEYSRPRIKDIDRYRAFGRMALQRIVPLLNKRADQVSSTDITKAREALRRQYASGTVRVTLDYLSIVYGWAVRERIVSANPCRGVERPEAEHSLDFLTREETRRLLETAEAGAAKPAGRLLHAAVAVALYTGLRKGEILGLRWIDLDLDTRRLTVARSYRRAPKSRKVRHLRLPSTLIPVLREWQKCCPRTAEGLVFPVGTAGCAGRVGSDKAMLGLPRLWEVVGLRKALHPWHVLRHSFASHFVMSGGNILSLQKMLGHSDLKMTLIYAHLAPDFLEAEIEKLRY